MLNLRRASQGRIQDLKLGVAQKWIVGKFENGGGVGGGVGGVLYQ